MECLVAAGNFAHRQRRGRVTSLGSCVSNSGFRSKSVFLKGAGHHRRLCSVEPQLQQRPLYCTQAWQRASSERSCAHRDKSVLTALFVTVQTIS